MFSVTGAVPVFYRAQTALLDSLVNSLALTFVLIAITLMFPPGRLPALHGKDCVNGDETPENYALCLSTAESGSGHSVYDACSYERAAFDDSIEFALGTATNLW